MVDPQENEKHTQTYFDYCELKGEVHITQPQRFFDFHPSKISTKVHKSIQGATKSYMQLLKRG
jgi:hypothetical protein